MDGMSTRAVVICLIVLLVLAAIFFTVSGVFRTEDTTILVPSPTSTTPVTGTATSSATSSTGWQTTEENGYTFEYPEGLGTAYIRVVDWPPQLEGTSTPFSCSESGDEITPAGKTELRTVGTHTYCVTISTEGAAGSIYTQHTYAFERGSEVLSFTFS